jgi:hypothetical protein
LIEDAQLKVLRGEDSHFRERKHHARCTIFTEFLHRIFAKELRVTSPLFSELLGIRQALLPIASNNDCFQALCPHHGAEPRATRSATAVMDNARKMHQVLTSLPYGSDRASGVTLLQGLLCLSSTLSPQSSGWLQFRMSVQQSKNNRLRRFPTEYDPIVSTPTKFVTEVSSRKGIRHRLRLWRDTHHQVSTCPDYSRPLKGTGCEDQDIAR